MAGIEIDFLTRDETQRDLCRRYWSIGDAGKFVHSVTGLAETFNVPKSQVAATVATLCNAFSGDELCASCGKPRVLTSRADYEQRRRYSYRVAWTCPQCVTAKQLEARRGLELAASQKMALLAKTLETRRADGLSLNGLSFVEVTYLVSVLRAGGSEDFSSIAPSELLKTPLSPTVEFDREIATHLVQAGILCIHPDSRPDSLILKDGNVTEFYATQVHWALPLRHDGPSAARFLEDAEALLKSSHDWPEAWEEESKELHRVVALQECFQYLRVALEEHRFDFQPGDRTRVVLRSVLKRFSVAQAYNFIWRAAKDAAAFYQRGGVSKTHAANTVPGKIQRMAEHAIAEGWNVTSYRRDFRAPESELSQVLFTMALRLQNGGFNSVPPQEQPLAAG